MSKDFGIAVLGGLGGDRYFITVKMFGALYSGVIELDKNGKSKRSVIHK